MWRLLRIALVCLLTVTLPLKGIAAVSMAACGGHSERGGQGGHAHGPALDDTAGGSAQGVHGHHEAHAGHGEHQAAGDDAVRADEPAHHAHAPDADPGDAAKASDHADHRHHGEAGKTKCSTCAPCCAAAAPGFAGLGLAHAEQATRTARLEDQALPGVTVALLHRPPISPVV